MKIVQVTPENVSSETLFCIKDLKKPGFAAKEAWYSKRYREGLRLSILKNAEDKMLGFVEYVPAADAWRPVDAPGYMFIHCMYVASRKDRNHGLGSLLVEHVETQAKEQGLGGICVMSSKGPWLAGKELFEKNGFTQADQRGRFELLVKQWDSALAPPALRDWKARQAEYPGWHLLYANQCPWHEKSVEAILNTAMDAGIEMQVHEILNAEEAKNSPSGFGVFALLHDGELLEDHYLSATRFKNILKKEYA
jgi:GNAT superfamily N-acetyltransferase